MQLTGVIQARLGSSRLRNKMTLEICGKPIVQLMLERIQQSKLVPTWILATTDRGEDDELADLASLLGVECFRGNSEDVLDRLYCCANKFEIEAMVRVCGDNPLLDPRIIDATAGEFLSLKGDCDYFSNHHPPTFPDGQEVEIIPLKSLDVSWREAKKDHERIHGTPFLWDQPERFKLGNLECRHNLHEQHRWTIDYLEDYELIKAVFENLYEDCPEFSMEDVIDLMKREPSIYRINEMHRGKSWHLNEKQNLSSKTKWIQK